ncbi:unnamed protein product [Haemonchus placei]|uniref:MFS domain-containing protein n=1 Tax=Haemonchus placei TaxID=6290 RepID=A0A0N4W8C8_HAEPC|nr:unnamed protein product [Haemonchus placei]
MPLAGIICESSYGWRSLYYLQGLFTLLLFALFCYFFQDSPTLHKNVSEKELTKIQLDKTYADSSAREPVPFFNVIRDPCIFGIFLSDVGAHLGFLTFLYYGPVYVNKVLHFEVKSTGFATALPYLLCAAVKMAAGPTSDRGICISERTRVIIFGSISQGCMAICFFALAFTDSPHLAQALYTSAIVFSGLNIVGAAKCAQLRARQHAHFVMAVLSSIGCIITLLLPVFVTLVCPDNTHTQWSRLFLEIAVIVVVMNLPFVFVAQTEPAPWTAPGFAASLSKKIANETKLPAVIQFEVLPAILLEDDERTEEIGLFGVEMVTTTGDTTCLPTTDDDGVTDDEDRRRFELVDERRPGV